jgi:hypothetical protein
MAVLRTEDGRTYLRHDAINTMIAPTRIEAVPVPPGLDVLLAKAELTTDEMELLLADGCGAAWTRTELEPGGHRPLPRCSSPACLRSSAQALAIIQPGDALRIFAGTEHWSVLTTDHRGKTILCLSRPPGYAHAYTNTKIRIA